MRDGFVNPASLQSYADLAGRNREGQYFFGALNAQFRGGAVHRLRLALADKADEIANKLVVIVEQNVSGADPDELGATARLNHGNNFGLDRLASSVKVECFDRFAPSLKFTTSSA